MVVGIMMDILQPDGSTSALPNNIKQALKQEWDQDNQAMNIDHAVRQ